MPLYLNADQIDAGQLSTLTPDAITEENIVFVEGPDDDHFIRAVLKNIGVDRGVQIIRTGGITQFPSKFQAKIKESNFKAVRCIAIIIDADSSKEEALKMVRKTLVTNSFSAPNEHGIPVECDKRNVKVGVFIISKPGENSGMLEDLFIETQKDTPISAHVGKYISGLAESLEKHMPEKGIPRPTPKDFRYPNNESKARTRAILSGFYDDISTVGYAAQHGYIDMNNSSLDEIKTFLQNIFNLQE